MSKIYVPLKYSALHKVFFALFVQQITDIIHQKKITGKCTIRIEVDERTFDFLQEQPDIVSNLNDMIMDITSVKHKFHLKKKVGKLSSGFPISIFVIHNGVQIERSFFVGDIVHYIDNMLSKYLRSDTYV